MSEELPQDAVEIVGGVTESKAPAHPSWLPFAIDFGPLILFFATYKIARNDGLFGDTIGTMFATGVFMMAIVVALIVSQWRLKRITPMLWFSAILVIGFGSLTLYLQDGEFIKNKATFIYGGCAILLIGGWLRKKALLKVLLQAAYDGLTDEGWLKLSRNWGFFFAAMAIINDQLVRHLSDDNYWNVKVLGVTALSFLFAMSQVPLLLRHGLNIKDK